MEDGIEDLRAELVSLENRVRELEDERAELKELNSDMLETNERLKNCINCKHKKWCKEIPDDFLACRDWDWED